MKKILIVDDEQEIRDIIQLLLECEFQNEVLLAESGRAAIALLEEHGDSIGVILSDYNMPDGNGGELYRYNCEKFKIPFILVTGGYVEDYPELDGFLNQESFITGLISKPFEEELLFAKTREALEAVESSHNIQEVTPEKTDFVRVNIDIFVRRFLTYNVDLFLRLKGGKIIQIFTKKDDVSSADILKYRDKGEREIFFKSSDFVMIKNELFESIMNKLSAANNLEEALDATGDTINFVTTCLDFLDVTPKQVELVHHTVDTCLRVLEEHAQQEEPSLKDFFALFKQEQGYLVGHSIIIIHLCYMMMRKAGIFSKDNMERLSYAAILHDFEHYNYDYASILGQDDERFTQLDLKGRDSVLNHMYWANEKVIKMQGVPEEVGGIILVHHEQADGSGFPRGIANKNMTVLQALFILALRVAHHIYFHHEDKKELINFIESLNVSYRKGPFKKLYDALLAITA